MNVTAIATTVGQMAGVLPTETVKTEKQESSVWGKLGQLGKAAMVGIDGAYNLYKGVSTLDGHYAIKGGMQIGGVVAGIAATTLYPPAGMAILNFVANNEATMYKA